MASVAVTLTALFIFGCIKGRFTGIALVARRVSDHPDRRPGRGGRLCYRETFSVTLFKLHCVRSLPPDRLKPGSSVTLFFKFIVWRPLK